jgi:hypothetical protein
MHFICRSELAAYELEAIAGRLMKLSGEFEESLDNHEEWNLGAGDT